MGSGIEIALGTVITIGSLVAAIVWAVSKIKTTAAVLGERVDHLTGSMDKLDRTFVRFDKDIQMLDKRVTRLEDNAVMKDQTRDLAKAVADELRKQA